MTVVIDFVVLRSFGFVANVVSHHLHVFPVCRNIFFVVVAVIFVIVEVFIVTLHSPLCIPCVATRGPCTRQPTLPSPSCKPPVGPGREWWIFIKDDDSNEENDSNKRTTIKNNRTVKQRQQWSVISSLDLHFEATTCLFHLKETLHSQPQVTSVSFSRSGFWFSFSCLAALSSQLQYRKAMEKYRVTKKVLGSGHVTINKVQLW